MQGILKIFAFSFRQKLASKSFRRLTLIVAIILFLLPAILLPILVKGDGEETSPTDPAVYSLKGIQQVFCVVERSERADYWKEFMAYAEEALPVMDDTAGDLAFSSYPDVSAAAVAASGTRGTVILRIMENSDTLLFNAVLPEGSSLAQETAETLAGELMNLYQEYRILALNLTPAQQAIWEAPLSAFMPEEGSGTESTDPGEAEATTQPMEVPNRESERLRKMLPLFALLNTMLVYFLVLFNNRDIGQSVVLEKASKLMDTFLLSVKPRAMVLGKVLSVWLSALLQCLIWILALIAGLLAGVKLAQRIHPASAAVFSALLGAVREGARLLSLPNILLAIAILAAGFLVYMSLAAIFASFASRQEELSASQGVFTMVLIVPYFIAISRLTDAAEEVGMMWYDFIPIISCMLTPARTLVGAVSLLEGTLSLLISLMLAILFTAMAGRVYSMMSLYKGNTVKPADMLKMVFRKG